VFADLELVAVGQSVGFDAPSVDIGAVERAAVVEEVVGPALDEDRVIAGDGDVVEEDVAVGAATDAHAVLLQRKALAGAAASGPDHERRAAGDDVAELDLLDLTGLADFVARGSRARRRLGLGQEGAAATA